MSHPNQPGFVYPTAQQPAYPAYPAYPAPTRKSQENLSQPSAEQPAYSAYSAHSAYPANTRKSQGSHNQPPAYQHQPFPGPIQNQPGQHGYAQQPYQQQSNWSANPNFQNYLMHATSFHVKQKLELLEVLVGFETENKYTVKDQNGNKLFYVIEESHWCGRLCCGKERAFTLRVKDVRGMDVLIIERGLDCTLCCGLCCPDSVKITDGHGILLGTVDEEFNLLYPKFKLKDAGGVTRLKADGPLCVFSCGGAITFNVTSPEGMNVGRISKEWAGFVQELFTDADYFAMSFPQNLSPEMKAVCLGLLFMIDFHYFESGGGDSHQGGRRLFS